MLTLLVLILKAGGGACLIIHISLAHTANLRWFFFVIFYMKENHKPIKSSFSLTETFVTFGAWETFPLISVAMSVGNSQNNPNQVTCQPFFFPMIRI